MRKEMVYISQIGNRGVVIYGTIRHDKTQLSLFLLCVFYAVHLQSLDLDWRGDNEEM